MVIEQEAEMDHTETGALSTWLVQAQTLDHCMLSRDFVGAHTILDQLLQDTLMDDALQSAGQMRIVRLHMSTLIDTIRMALMSMGKLSETGEAFRRSIMNDLTNADSIPKIRDCIQNMCTGFAELFAMEAGTDQMEARNREIIDYIESHFRDPDLNLNALSQQFALSASYISTLIKKVAGLSPIDLIHSLRISEAKRLLTSHPKMLVKDIAETVGYGSSLNLIRAFRRSEGVTPTMYRNLMNSKEQDGQNT